MDGQYGLRRCWLQRLELGFGKLPLAALTTLAALAALSAAAALTALAAAEPVATALASASELSALSATALSATTLAAAAEPSIAKPSTVFAKGWYDSMRPMRKRPAASRLLARNRCWPRVWFTLKANGLKRMPRIGPQGSSFPPPTWHSSSIAPKIGSKLQACLCGPLGSASTLISVFEGMYL